MNTQLLNNLINELFIYNKNYNSIINQIVVIGQDAIPQLLLAIREREFAHAQNQVESNENKFRLISMALVGIVTNEKDTLIKSQIVMKIIDEIEGYLKWEIKINFSSREEFNKLFKELFDENLYNKACESALLMGELRDASALPYLFQVITNNDIHPTIRENAIIALGKIGNEDAIPQLISLINTSNYNMHFAVQALVKIGSSKAVPDLLNSLETVRTIDEDIQADIIWALGELHDPLSIPKLTEWIKTHKADMKAVAIQSLGNIRHPDAVPILKTCLSDNTILNRQDLGGTLWLFRRYRGKKISNMAFESLEKIGTPEALDVIAKWKV